MSEKVVHEVSIDLSDYFQQTKDYILAKKICDRLSIAGFKAYFAGGCVRDAVLKRRFNDIDVATNALPEEIEKLFLGKIIPVGKKFGILIIHDQGEQIEVATFRKDGKYEDGRRPETIEYADEREDALRRDFTVNALFYDVKNKKILDYVDGLKDIQQKKMKTVGDPLQRFSEDYLRVLRLFRFADSLGFTIDSETLKSALELKENLKGVSLERRREELLKSFKDTSNALKLVKLYSENNLWKFYLGVEHLDTEKYLFNEKPTSEEEVLSCLLWNVSHYKELLKGLRISHQVFKSVVAVLQFKDDIDKIFSYDEGKLRYLCLNGDFHQFLKLARKTVLEKDLKSKITTYYLLSESYMKDKPKPLLKGEDLKAFFQGKELGEVLELAFQEQLLNPEISKEILLEKVKKKRVET